MPHLKIHDILQIENSTNCRPKRTMPVVLFVHVTHKIADFSNKLFLAVKNNLKCKEHAKLFNM